MNIERSMAYVVIEADLKLAITSTSILTHHFLTFQYQLDINTTSILNYPIGIDKYDIIITTPIKIKSKKGQYYFGVLASTFKILLIRCYNPLQARKYLIVHN